MIDDRSLATRRNKRRADRRRPTDLSPPSPQVCELDIMFNLEKAHFILDEM